jgi:hypothetical protein
MLSIKRRFRRLSERLGWPSAPPRWANADAVFGLSTGRCGTTTLSKLFNLAPQVRAYHEPKPGVGNPVRSAPYYGVKSPSQLQAEFARFRAAEIYRHVKDGLAYVEVNGLKFHAPAIAESMPNSRFFFVHRHPLEFVCSGLRRGWYESHAADATRLRPRAGDPADERWEEWSRFEKICWLWSATNDYFVSFLATVDPARYVVLPFAELVDAETGRWRELFDLARVPAPQASRAGEVLSVRHNEQTSGENLSYDALTDEQWSQLERIAGDTMQRLGYESGRPAPCPLPEASR